MLLVLYFYKKFKFLYICYDDWSYCTPYLGLLIRIYIDLLEKRIGFSLNLQLFVTNFFFERVEKWQPLLTKRFVRVYNFLLRVAYYSYYITKCLKFYRSLCSSAIFCHWDFYYSLYVVFEYLLASSAQI
jgi:hypothetical protein